MMVMKNMIMIRGIWNRKEGFCIDRIKYVNRGKENRFSPLAEEKSSFIRLPASHKNLPAAEIQSSISSHEHLASGVKALAMLQVNTYSLPSSELISYLDGLSREIEKMKEAK